MGICDQLLCREAEWHFYPEKSLQEYLNKVSTNLGLLKATRQIANLKNLSVLSFPRSEFVANVGRNNYSRKQKLNYTFLLYTKIARFHLLFETYF